MSKSNKCFSIRRYWTVCDVVAVEANSAKEANRIAMDMPLSKAPNYVMDSITNDPSEDVTESTVNKKSA